MSKARFYFASESSSETRDRWINSRNPPLLWRRLIVGTVMIMPGTIVGLIIGLAAPPLALTFAFLGGLIGFLGGIFMERE